MANVSIKVTLGSLSVEVSGPSKYAESKVDELVKKYSVPVEGVRATPHQQVKASASAKPSGKMLAPSEFLRKANPRSQNERALLLGYYLEKHAGCESFTSGELMEVNKKAKQPAFANVSDCLAKLVAQGLVMGAGDKESRRAYALTTTGEDQVAEMLKSSSDEK